MDARFVGNWRLISQIERNAHGDEYFARGEHPLGLLIYDAGGLMAVHLMRPDASGDLRDFNTAMEQYLGYYGRYTVDAERQIVTHHLEACSYVPWIGSDQTRQFVFSDQDRHLTLTAVTVNAGQTVTRVLGWERISA